jgi:CubicO group peptidase (beta-lactamase class C family)
MTLKPYTHCRQLIGGFILALAFTSASGQVVQNLDSLFNTLHKQANLSSVVLIAEDGKPIYQKAFGYADFNSKRPLDINTVFELASVSKQFTAMAIMQLHQNHKLNYEDDVVRYLPQLPYKGITINHLLHHTSGLPEFLMWDSRLIDVTRINYNADILASLIKNAPPLNFTPGQKLSYSNTNYVLLALIVEKASGLTFDKYLDQHIFKPLGMANTRVYPQRAAKQKMANYALGHVYDAGRNRYVVSDSLVANRYQYYFDGVAGPYGISSNTADMLKWDQALYTEKLVTKAEQELAYIPSKLTDGSTALMMGMPYGFGWLIPAAAEYGKRYFHTGGYPGYETIITRYPEKRKTIILLTNIYNTVNIYQITGSVENILFNKPFSIPPTKPFEKSVSVSPAQLKAIEGSYTSILFGKMIVTTEAGQAYAQIVGQPKVEIYPESESKFFYTIVPAKIQFTNGSDGKANKLVLLQNGMSMEAVKE